MIKYFLVFILAISFIPVSISAYEYFYIERDYILSRGLYMSTSLYICDDTVLYKKRYGAVFNKDGSLVECKTIRMLPVERYE